MFAKVAPALKIPRSLPDLFDYSVPEELKSQITPGSIVTVPWRGRGIPGVVFSITETPEIDPKKVKPLSGLAAHVTLPQDLLEALKEEARTCAAPLGTLVNALVPSIPKRYKFQETTANEQLDKGEFAAGIEIYRNAKEKREYISARVSSLQEEGKGILVLLPHLEDVEQATAALNARGIEPIAIHGQVAMAKLWKAWSSSADSPSVVVGTRLAAGAPVANLAEIIVVESESVDHRQYDQNPRYDARSIALSRCRASGARLTYLSVAPRAEDYRTVEEFGTKPKLPKPAGNITLSTLGKRRADSESLLTKAAENAISEALQSQKKVIIFHNRKGTAGAVLCRDCGKVLRCNECLSALSEHGSALRCGRCGKTSQLPDSCESCGGIEFRSIGLGTAALPEILNESFPEARIAIVDADNRKTGKSIDEADIVVGTQLLLHQLTEGSMAPEIGAIIVTLAEDLLVSSGFRATEQAWRTVSALSRLADSQEAPLVLQVFDADQPEVRALLLGHEQAYLEELEARKIANFPPFGNLTAVIAVANSEFAATSAAKDLSSKLQALRLPSVAVTGPVRPRQPFKNGSWRSLVVIRSKNSETLRKFLRTLPESCIVDTDPDYLG